MPVNIGMTDFLDGEESPDNPGWNCLLAVFIGSASLAARAPVQAVRA
ncbi:hypothetical protein BBOH_0753 [Bifidobacterium bohemicum DSM 22767]|uniref:Uncharacterized protein n=1 Tax=Bifidobacterium bohemicum DSM 22767 TaxID=1437606 RepID=A0A086ZHE6_9BIFI|nr:hypothetical protein BBOH_0753 [Bifidobacterium bohemicum DSM 22767]